MSEVIAIEGNGARPSHRGGGYSTDGVMFTLNATEVHAVAYGVDCRNVALTEEINGTLQAKPNGGFSVNCNTVVMQQR